MPERGGGTRRRTVLVGRCQPLETLERALDRGAMDLEPLREVPEARFRRVPACLGHHPHDVRLGGETAVGVERVDRVKLADRGAHRALEVRRFGIEDAVQLAAQRPRYLSRLELEERAAGADPPQEGADRLAVLRCDDTPAAAETP